MLHVFSESTDTSPIDGRWIWHRLGKLIKKILPAFVVSKIRMEFTSDTYMGYRGAAPL